MSILNQHVNLDMPAEKYHAVDALSKSMMSKILKSPAHYRAALDEHQEPTKSMQMGTAIHTAVLEPQLYSQVVAVVPPDIDGRTKEGKQWKEAHKSRIHLTHAEDIDVQGVANSVRRHPFWDIIHLSHKIEASVFAQDEQTGLALKARPDLWIEGHTLIAKRRMPLVFTSWTLNGFRLARIFAAKQSQRCMNAAHWRVGQPIRQPFKHFLALSGS